MSLRIELSVIDPKGAFGWAITSGKVDVGYGRRKSSCAAVEQK